MSWFFIYPASSFMIPAWEEISDNEQCYDLSMREVNQTILLKWARKQNQTNKSSSGKTDPYDIHITLLHIFENQVVPVGLHYLSKSFKPNLVTITILSVGTKFIPSGKKKHQRHI